MYSMYVCMYVHEGVYVMYGEMGLFVLNKGFYVKCKERVVYRRMGSVRVYEKHTYIRSKND